MSTKAETLRDPMSCLNRASPIEPIFVLRAKDPIAAQVIRLWAAMAAGVHEDDKITEAHDVASAFIKWRDWTIPEALPTVAGAQQAAYNPVPLSIRRGN